VIAVLVLVLGASWTVVACKQAEGERCQVNEDCADNLVCNQATQECSTTTGGGIDATVPDGPPPDAAVDAMIDAMPDAP
jgi:hypothetical protein